MLMDKSTSAIDNEELCKQLAELYQELEIKKGLLGKLEEENSTLKEKIKFLSNELAEEKALRFKYAEWYMNISTATFWRLSKPLRTFCDYFKKNK